MPADAKKWFDYELGKPNETRKEGDQELPVRDELGLSIDPKYWADPNCSCKGQGMVMKYRPFTNKQVDQLLKDDPKAVEALIFKCPHGRQMDVDCRKCGRLPGIRYVNRNMQHGAVFISFGPCSCPKARYDRARKEILSQGARISGPMLGMMSLLAQVQRVSKNVDVQCKHKVPMKEACEPCGRKAGAPINVEFKVKS